MLVKANVLLYIESNAADLEEAQVSITNSLEAGLAAAMAGFPEGSIELVDTESVTAVSDAEAEEKGLVE